MRRQRIKEIEYSSLDLESEGYRKNWQHVEFSNEWLLSWFGRSVDSKGWIHVRQVEDRLRSNKIQLYSINELTLIFTIFAFVRVCLLNTRIFQKRKYKIKTFQDFKWSNKNRLTCLHIKTSEKNRLNLEIEIHEIIHQRTA